MRWTVARRLAALLLLASSASASTATGDEGPNLDGLSQGAPKLADTEVARSKLEDTIRAADQVTKELGEVLDRTPVGGTPPPSPAAAPSGDAPEAPAKPFDPSDPSSAKVDAEARLKALAKEKPEAVKDLREALVARLKLAEEWDRATALLQESEQPKVSPDREIAELRRDLERAKAALARFQRDPDSVLGGPFRRARGSVTDGALKEMKGEIDLAAEAVRDLKTAHERKAASRLENLKTYRESVHKRREERDGRSKQVVADLAAATTSDARAVGRERLINDRLEERVLSQYHEAIEAAIALETRREPLVELRQQLLAAERELAAKTLELMQSRYRALAEHQQGNLARKAAVEQDRSQRSSDPMERYRARRAAELLDLEAVLLRDERTLAAKPVICEEDQRALADRAQEDFDHLKALVEGGRSNALVATRLNNSYRRTASERERIVRHDLTRASALLSLYENALTDVELDQLNDARDDRAPLDSLLEALPPSGRAAAQALASEFDARKRTLLDDRHRTLQNLAVRADKAQQQVQRRLRILDEQHAFIRTRIFWVRDAAPLGADTFKRAAVESQRLFHGGLRIARETGDTPHWGRTSWEFGIACLGVVVLPWPLALARRALRTPVAS